MIEPMVSEKQCRMCMECKPLTMFSPSIRGGMGVQPYCKACRSRAQASRNRAMRKTERIYAAPRSIIWPRETRELVLDVELRMWPAVEPGALRFVM